MCVGVGAGVCGCVCERVGAGGACVLGGGLTREQGGDTIIKNVMDKMITLAN